MRIGRTSWPHPTPNSNRTVHLVFNQSQSENLQRRSPVIGNVAATGLNRIDTTCGLCSVQFCDVVFDKQPRSGLCWTCVRAAVFLMASRSCPDELICLAINSRLSHSKVPRGRDLGERGCWFVLKLLFYAVKKHGETREGRGHGPSISQFSGFHFLRRGL